MDEKLLEFLCRDKKMKGAHEQKRDLYSTLASIIFNTPYEDCLDNSSRLGQKRRFIAKALALSFYSGTFEYYECIDTQLDIKE